MTGQTVALRSDKPFVTSRESARIELRVLDETGRPVRGARVSLTVNVGSVTEPVATREGPLVATYRPATQEGAQVALFHATVKSGPASGSGGWLSLPIHGRHLLRVQAPPRARVRVSIEGTSFGPVTAGADGTATVPVELPPGISSAQVTTVDRSGQSRTQEVPLPAPRFARIRLVAPAEAPSWEKPVRIQGFVVDERGNPALSLPPIAVSTERGTLGPIEPKEGATFEVPYTGPEQTQAPVTLSASTVEDAERASTLQLAPRPGPLARLGITLSPANFTAGSTEPIVIEAVGYDAKGNPLPAPPATFSTEVGTLEAEEGGRRARIRPPDAFGAKKALAIRVQAGALQGQGELALQSGPPVRGEASVQPALSGNGDEVEVTGRFVDAWDNPVDGLSVVGTSPSGSLTGPEALGEGRYRFRFSPAPGQAVGGSAPFELRAEGFPVATSGTVPVLARRTRWQPSLGLLGFVQSNTALSNSLGMRMEGSLRIADLPWEALLQLEARYNRRETQLLSSSDSSSVEKVFSLNGYSARLGARWSHPVLRRGVLFADASAGYLRMSGQVKVEGLGEMVPQPILSRGLVVSVGGGLGWTMGPGRLVGQLQWAQAPGRGLVSGNLGGLSLGAGYQLPLSGGVDR
ncbi:hypothetical protein [Hyalangium rubrum]|uniref:Big-1 domain-containing protein n=1 Tax=Hyalangium rubrum TaxID=3103134 RepID=A0ABU5HI56_9BACT|nr:hypothetical protein [Hyalangium sp. s54d21]MDY7232559.1 hypothetical protein [Hyalangium sp. s54d21]